MNYLNEEGKIVVWPSKRNKKIEVLKYMVTKFLYNRIYTEKEVNAIIDAFHTFNDYFLIRRELVDYKLLIRTRDGARYWKGDVLPVAFETERLMVRDAVNEDEEGLIEVNQSLAYMEELTGVKHEPDYIKTILKEGDLPPQGLIEFYRLKSIVKKENNEIIGFIEYYLGYPTSDSLWIGTFYIKKEFQKKQFGREIIEKLYELLENTSISNISLGVHLKNWPALRFWVNNGFTQIIKIVGDKEFSGNTYSIIALKNTLIHNLKS